MFDKPSGSAPAKPAQPADWSQDPREQALQHAIRERSKLDPLVGPKMGAKEVFQHLLRAMKNERGVHVESLLCALGALAGYACQASLRAQALKKGLRETAALMVVTTKDGRDYFFGDPLNELLVGAGPSVWGLTGGAAQGGGALPDLDEMFKHTAGAVGTDQFGIPRVPQQHAPGDTPIHFLKVLWPALLPLVKRWCTDPAHWPVLYGLAIQEAIDAGKGVIEPALAARVVMESAIPMSKVDLARA